MTDSIIVRGASEHNLKHIDVDLRKGRSFVEGHSLHSAPRHRQEAHHG